MDTKKINISSSVLTAPIEDLGPNFISQLVRLKTLGFAIICESSDWSSLSKILSHDKLLTADANDTGVKKTTLIDFNPTSKEFQLIGYGDNRHHSSFEELVNSIAYPFRHHIVKRETKETKINIELNLDGTGLSEISTGLHFFDHMLDQIAKHGRFDLKLTCNGDLAVDEHHTIEDTAIALGEAFLGAIGDKKGINRYAFVMPMDESKCEIALDLSGRPFLVYNADLNREYVGDFPTEMTQHFFYSLAIAMKATLHITVTGDNDHHKIESMFKALALVLRDAVHRSEGYLNVIPSSKGVL